MHIFSRGESVYKDNLKGKKWLPSSIVQKTGPISFKVTLEDGKTIRCHQDQLRKCYIDETVMTSE